MKAHEFLAEAEATKSYEIKPGDTLTRIASKNNTTIDAIMALNQGNRAIRDRDTIYAGNTIKVPTTSTGFDSSARVKRQGSTDVDKPDTAKTDNRESPKAPVVPVPNDDMGGENFGIDDPDWEFPTVELGFGDPGYTPIIGNRVEKRPNGNWYYPGNPYPVRPDVARFAEKRLKDLASTPKTNKPKDSGGSQIPVLPPRPKSSKLPGRSGQVRAGNDDISPIPGAWVTDRFGSPRPGRTHQGIDLHADIGTTVLAPNNGKVLDVGYGPTTGHYITLGDMQGNKAHRFMHLSKSLVDQGDTVRQGQEIAKSGNSGFSERTNKSYPAHLHWEKFVNGEPVDPAKFISLPTKP